MVNSYLNFRSITNIHSITEFPLDRENHGNFVIFNKNHGKLYEILENFTGYKHLTFASSLTYLSPVIG